MSRRLAKFLLLITTVYFSAFAHAEMVTESWMRQAGISCGGGMSIALQGEIDAAVIRRLKIGSVNGSGTYQKSEAESLLKQFKQEERDESYRNYISCLIKLMDMASANSGLPSKEVILNSSVAIAPLETVMRGQRFLMKTGDSIAVKNHAIIFTLNRVLKGEIKVTWSNSETGKTAANLQTSQAQIIQLGDQCSLVPYKIEEDKKQASFLSNC